MSEDKTKQLIYDKQLIDDFDDTIDSMKKLSASLIKADVNRNKLDLKAASEYINRVVTDIEVTKYQYLKKLNNNMI